MVSFNIENAGSYEFMIIASESENECGSDTCTFTLDVTMNVPPIITKGNTSFYDCYPQEVYTYDLSYFNAELTSAFFSLTSEFGTIDSLTGLISFTADTIGVYCFDVVLTDDCGATDTRQICITVDWNTAPVVVLGNDTSITGCDIGEICIPVNSYDIDNNIVSINSSFGIYSNNQVCFTPDTSGTYIIEVTIMDDCEATDVDEVIVNVEVNSSFIVDCPESQELFICAPDTLCFDIPGIPEDASVTVDPPSSWYNSESGQICFYTNCSVEKNVSVSIVDECGSEDCNFTVNVTMNSAPLVIMPPDSAIEICVAEEICLPVGVSDLDNNIESISVTPYGVYNEITGEICIMPYESGVYTILVTATDSCGISDIDSTNLYIDINQNPTVSFANDTSVFLCEPVEVCLPVEIDDYDNNISNITVSPSGTYNSDNGTVCIMAEIAGEFQIIVTATDSCGAIGVDTALVTVSLNAPPVVVSAPDSTIFMCDPAMICFPVDISDDNNAITNIDVIGGSYSNGFVCFTPDNEGSFAIIITAFDDCGNSASDSTSITVVTNTPPIVTMGDDDSLFLCEMEEVCVDVNIHDDDANIMSVSSNIGYYDMRLGKVCFTPETIGIYEIIVTASDSCYLIDSDTAIIEITSGEVAVIECPDSPIEIGTCEGLPITHQLAIYSDDAIVTTSYGTIVDGLLTFTPDTSGTYIIYINAESDCGNDECVITFIIEIGEAPVLACPPDTSIELCGSDQICLPFGDLPQFTNLDIAPIGSIVDGQFCFDVDSSGHYAFKIIADNDCGADTCTFAVDIAFNGAPEITDIDTSFFACEPGQMLLFVKALDNEQDAINYELISGGGAIDSETGIVSFDADTVGTYCFTVTASDLCGSDTAEICMVIDFNTSPIVTLPEDETYNLCEPSEICIPYDVSDADDNISSPISVNNPFYWKEGVVCLFADTSGIYTIVVAASDDCSAFDADTVNLTVNLNSAPYISGPTSIDKFLCAVEEICIDIEYGDIDNNVMSVTSSFGIFDSQTSQVCFIPDTAGTYTITTTVSDSCYLTDELITEIHVDFGETVELICPIDPLNIFLCEPQEYCYTVDYNQSNAIITSTLGSIIGDRLCFMVDTTGTYEATIIATADCGADTCYVAFEIVVGETVEIACPEYEELFLCEPQMIEKQISIYPTDAQITVLPTGTYNPDNQTISFLADMAGMYEFTIIGEIDCTVDTCNFAVKVDMNQAPIITKGDTAVFICNPGEEVSYDLSYHDGDRDPAIFSLVSGYGSIDSLSGLITFNPDTSGIYCFDVVLTDACGVTDNKTICITVDINTAPIVISAPDNIYELCELSEICFPVEVYDVENNIESIETNIGNYDNGTLCFLPSEAGVYEIITTVTDECGAKTSDTSLITIDLVPPVVIECPADTSVELCAPMTIEKQISVNQSYAQITVTPQGTYNPDDQTISFFADMDGVYDFTVIAENECSADTCDFTVNVEMNQAPIITKGDTAVFICEPYEEVSYDLSYHDGDRDPAIFTLTSGYGSIDSLSGLITFNPDTSGIYCFDVVLPTASAPHSSIADVINSYTPEDVGVKQNNPSE